jgi:hypothetical protein
MRVTDGRATDMRVTDMRTVAEGLAPHLLRELGFQSQPGRVPAIHISSARA